MKFIIFPALALFSMVNVHAQHILFLLGEKEYKTLETVPEYFESELKPAGYTATFISASFEDDQRNHFPGMAEAIEKADLCFISVRRRAPESAGMQALKKHVAAGKPIVAIRTSSHAFHLRGKSAPDGHELWEEFDPGVLGGNYNGHYKSELAKITVAENAGDHPVLNGVGQLQPSDKLYKAAPLTGSTTLLLNGTIEGKPSEPVAWTNATGENSARVFYTSLGQTTDFSDPEFRKLLTNAVSWATEKSAPWIIDPHTHFKGEAQIAHDTKGKKIHPKNTLTQVVYPEDYRATADRLGIQSTVIMEAVDQSTPQFNDWVFEEAAKSNLVSGYVARGDLLSPEFPARYERYKKTGYLNGYRFRRDELHHYLADEGARKNLKLLEKDAMVVDLLIEPAHAPDAIQLAREFPGIKVVINHCFRARMVDGTIDDAWKKAVKDCAALPNMYMKISSILNFAGTKPFDETAPGDMEFYLPVLEPCFAAYGEDRVIFASNLGVAAHFGKPDDIVRIVVEFLKTKGESALKKGMRDNAIRVYNIDTSLLR